VSRLEARCSPKGRLCLDRLGRSLIHLIEAVGDLKSRSVAFRSLCENIDTSSAAGELVFHLFGALAQFERRLIRERTRAGLEAAKSCGTKLGRRASLTFAQVKHACQLIAEGVMSPGCLGSATRAYSAP
jgi:DNA invertase Pin-like site-specific DNA recombinase